MMVKIGAMVLYHDDEDYLPYCLKSLATCVDKIFICTSRDEQCYNASNIARKHIEGVPVLVIQSESIDDFSMMRNDTLKAMKGMDWVVMLDSDEVLAKNNGEPLKKEDLELIIKHNKDKRMFHFFTLHFMYNYRMIDGTRDGQHWSIDRFYQIKGKGVIPPKYIRAVHEYINHTPEYRSKYSAKATMGPLVPTIFHFGHCKGMEKLRQKYHRTLSIPGNPFTAQLEAYGYKTINQYCANHEIFRMTKPIMLYDGPLPKCMDLW